MVHPGSLKHAAQKETQMRKPLSLFWYASIYVYDRLSFISSINNILIQLMILHLATSLMTLLWEYEKKTANL